VIGVPDARMGEEVCACIRLVNGAKLTADQVKQYCKGKVRSHVRGSVHHCIIHTEIANKMQHNFFIITNLCIKLVIIKKLYYDAWPTKYQDATVYQNLLFHVYMKLNVFRAPHRPSSGA